MKQQRKTLRKTSPFYRTRVLIGVLAIMMAWVFSRASVYAAETEPRQVAKGVASYRGYALLESRNVFKQPFVSHSIWNLPIHDDAKYEAAPIAKTEVFGPEDNYMMFNSAAPKRPLWKMKKEVCWGKGIGFAERCGTLTGEKVVPFDVPIPLGYTTRDRYGARPNNSAGILRPDGRSFIDTQPFEVCDISGKAVSHYLPGKNVSLFGTSLEEPGSQGASHLSGIGGAIRPGELVPGGEIRHAMKIVLMTGEQYRPGADNPNAYVWPAKSADGHRLYSGKNPWVRMGAHFSLKPGFDLRQLQTEPGRILGRAFQDYGAYLVDSAGKTAAGVWNQKMIAMGNECLPGASSVVSAVKEFEKTWGYPFMWNDHMKRTTNGQWRADVEMIFQNLYVIPNRGGDSAKECENFIGGGPTNDPQSRRRAPVAPEPN